jgi:2-methylisocitrate lyase-like PEP mutase family enzyme
VGADVLYAPWLRTADDISAVCDAISQPLNVLATSDLSFAEITAAGAKRVSVGARLTWAAVEAAEAAARGLLAGDLSGLRSSPALDDWFR